MTHLGNQLGVNFLSLARIYIYSVYIYNVYI
jgi:hypothetical protein